jgi:hypothetical protein
MIEGSPEEKNLHFPPVFVKTRGQYGGEHALVLLVPGTKIHVPGMRYA